MIDFEKETAKNGMFEVHFKSGGFDGEDLQSLCKEIAGFFATEFRGGLTACACEKIDFIVFTDNKTGVEVEKEQCFVDEFQKRIEVLAEEDYTIRVKEAYLEEDFCKSRSPYPYGNRPGRECALNNFNGA